MTDQGICELFYEAVMWAGENGAPAPLDSLPGLWEGEIGEFRIAINGHRVEHKTAEGLGVPPFHVAINAPKYIGAVILVNHAGGVGASGMEADVLAALKAARTALPPEGPEALNQ